ncbi:MAG TPA: SGNH/GDSL hydrolase family protein [Thermoanaerobaculia bacterium]|nr:SGNH/GDSL hydrolase family protein [Thermoanaerobaculia bacterium]
MNRRLFGPLILVLSLVVAFVIAEAGLRLASKYWLSVYDVEMWRYARQIKVLSRYPGVIEEQRPNASAYLMGARVRTEEHGFRLPDPATEARRQPTDRVAVAVGDSLTFGWGVPEGETFPDQLERLLAERCPRQGGRRATVHNAGIGNCNTYMELARYKLRIRPYLRPDWVIIGFSFNDAEADPVPSTNPFLWHSALLALASSRILKQSDPMLRDYHSYYVGLFTDGLPGWEHTKAAIRELGKILHDDGIPGTLIVLPELHDPHDPGLAEAFSRVAQVARQSGFEVVDPGPSFPPSPPKTGNGWESYWVSREDAHPNAKAQSIYARVLADSIDACRP